MHSSVHIPLRTTFRTSIMGPKKGFCRLIIHLSLGLSSKRQRFLTLFCRSSDLLRLACLPTLPTFGKKQWLKRLSKLTFGKMELTAAGLFGTFTRFPFHPTRSGKDFSEQNGAKICAFSLFCKKKRRKIHFPSPLINKEIQYLLSEVPLFLLLFQNSHLRYLQ